MTILEAFRIVVLKSEDETTEQWREAFGIVYQECHDAVARLAAREARGTGCGADGFRVHAEDAASLVALELREQEPPETAYAVRTEEHAQAYIRRRVSWRFADALRTERRGQGLEGDMDGSAPEHAPLPPAPGERIWDATEWGQAWACLVSKVQPAVLRAIRRADGRQMQERCFDELVRLENGNVSPHELYVAEHARARAGDADTLARARARVHTNHKRCRQRLLRHVGAWLESRALDQTQASLLEDVIADLGIEGVVPPAAGPASNTG